MKNKLHANVTSANVSFPTDTFIEPQSIYKKGMGLLDILLTKKNLHSLFIVRYILGGWSTIENCPIIDEVNEKCKLCSPYKQHSGHVVQIKNYNSCLENIYDFHTRGFLCSNFH